MAKWWSTDEVGDEMESIERGIAQAAREDEKKKATYEAVLAQTNRIGIEQDRKAGKR